MIRFIEQFKLINLLKALVPQCRRVFGNGLPRYARNDDQFTVHRSQFAKSAFTLAETLIVIGILGVVAALTLPNLNHATGDKERVTRVKKAYSALTEAFDRAQAVYGDYDTWADHNCSTGQCIMRRMSEFMKVSKDCITNVNAGCWTYGKGSGNEAAGTYFNQRGNGFGGDGMYPAVITADGMAIRFVTRGYSKDEEHYSFPCFEVDIDGPNKGKSYYGLDIFFFSANNNGLVAGITGNNDFSCTSVETSGEGTATQFSTLVKKIYNSGYCQSYWIINYDNMDYVKFTDEKGTCDNGNVVTESNPSCN